MTKIFDLVNFHTAYGTQVRLLDYYYNVVLHKVVPLPSLHKVIPLATQAGDSTLIMAT